MAVKSNSNQHHKVIVGGGLDKLTKTKNGAVGGAGGRGSSYVRSRKDSGYDLLPKNQSFADIYSTAAEINNGKSSISFHKEQFSTQ